MVLQNEKWMRMALRLAHRARGLTSPNPCVGAVLVKKGKMIGSGYHHRAGEKHAEVLAIEDARKRGQSPKGATLYVTLEPCCSHGKTAPCTEAIIREEIACVVCGMKDPNPNHDGKGLKKLQQQGIQTIVGVLEKECEELNRAFFHWIVHRTPWIIARIAMSADGRIAPKPGESRWLTSESAIRKSHEYRLCSDAILVGAETVRMDNPRLTIRYHPQAIKKLQPWRIILTRSGRLPAKAHLFTDSFKDRTVVFKKQNWHSILKRLGKWEVTCALLEGGGELIASAFEAGIVNEIAFFVAPKLIGGKVLAVATDRFFGKGYQIKNFCCEKLGPDLLIKGYVHRIG